MLFSNVPQRSHVLIQPQAHECFLHKRVHSANLWTYGLSWTVRKETKIPNWVLWEDWLSMYVPAESRWLLMAASLKYNLERQWRGNASTGQSCGQCTWASTVYKEKGPPGRGDIGLVGPWWMAQRVVAISLESRILTDGVKWNISCHISGQKMSQLSPISGLQMWMKLHWKHWY